MLLHHGTIFSLIFKKQFYVSQLHNTDRVLNILHHIDLQSRFIQDIKEFKIEQCNYDNTDEKMKSIKSISEKYIRMSIM